LVNVRRVRIGILCVQGDYEAHGRVLERLGVAWRDVRRAADLQDLDGLVLPGGESTTMWHFLRQDGLETALRAFARRGGALYGTCAGAILMAREVANPPSAGLGLIDMTVERNAYGRQTQSEVRLATLAPDGQTGGRERAGRAVTAAAGQIEAVLIRAPRIVRVGPRVRVIARLDGDPVWVEAGRAMATTFHPELGTELRPHERFIALAAAPPAPQVDRNCDQSRRKRLS
jgi:5'-phosphate synthase pdxT subunit